MRAYININRRTLLDNYEKIVQEVYPKKLFVVLKANAYGHGISEMAKLFATARNPGFVVATLEEAMMVRKSLVFNPLLLLESTSDYKTCVNLKLNVAVHTLGKLKEMADKRLPLSIHLNVNTGLNRDGLEPSEVEEAVQILRTSNLKLKGVYTHHSDPLNIKRENELFESVLPAFKPFGNILIHAGSSSAIDYEDGFSNAIRIGGSIYGLYHNQKVKTEPALELLAPIWHVKKVAKDDPVGYGTSFKVPADGYVYLLPIGYKDGFPRSRKTIGFLAGEILVQVGQTMMDHMIMFSKKEFGEGQTVELIGHNLNVFELAKLYKTIPYELCSTLGERLKRNYI